MDIQYQFAKVQAAAQAPYINWPDGRHIRQLSRSHVRAREPYMSLT